MFLLFSILILFYSNKINGVETNEDIKIKNMTICENLDLINNIWNNCKGLIFCYPISSTKIDWKFNKIFEIDNNTLYNNKCNELAIIKNESFNGMEIKSNLFLKRLNGSLHLKNVSINKIIEFLFDCVKLYKTTKEKINNSSQTDQKYRNEENEEKGQFPYINDFVGILALKMQINFNSLGKPNELIVNKNILNKIVEKCPKYMIELVKYQLFTITFKNKQIKYYIEKPKAPLCTDKTKILIMIPIRRNSFNLRNEIRNTYLNESFEGRVKARFIIADPHDSLTIEEQKIIFEEQNKYKDMIVINGFDDIYTNLHLKVMAAFQWNKEFCSNADWTLKIDDDMSVNISRLNFWIDNKFKNELRKNNATIFGRIYRNSLRMADMLCCTCNTPTSGAHLCKICQKPCHAIEPCAISCGEEGFGTNEAFFVCKRSGTNDFILYVQRLWDKNNFTHVYAADETAISLDPEGGLCVAEKGSKSVTVLSTGHEKTHITVMLTARTDGFKLRPFILLPRKRPIPEIEKRFKNKLILVWCGRNWMDDELTSKYLEEVFGNYLFGSRLLIWDSFRAHISKETKETLRRLAIHTAVIPGGTTKYIQVMLTGIGEFILGNLCIFFFLQIHWDSIGEFDENIHVFKVIISKYTLLNNKFKADGAIPKGIDLLRQRRCETEISELNLREEIDNEQDEICESDYSIEI
uniref:DDE-1 domain-containing protein n=1 Tax=Meloidogyne hapla TaxID=6305 RepID=A0A1I8B0C7_MELHA